MKIEQRLKQLLNKKTIKLKTFSTKIDEDYIEAIEKILKEYNIKKDELMKIILEESDILNLSKKIKSDKKSDKIEIKKLDRNEIIKAKEDSKTESNLINKIKEKKDSYKPFNSLNEL